MIGDSGVLLQVSTMRANAVMRLLSMECFRVVPFLIDAREEFRPSDWFRTIGEFHEWVMQSSETQFADKLRAAWGQIEADLYARNIPANLEVVANRIRAFKLPKGTERIEWSRDGKNIVIEINDWHDEFDSLERFLELLAKDAWRSNDDVHAHSVIRLAQELLALDNFPIRRPTD